MLPLDYLAAIEHIIRWHRMTDTVRTFKLVRTIDISGVSGTGVVAVGAQFPTGRVITEWLPGQFDVRSFNIYLNIEELRLINGHSGATLVVWDGDA